MNIETGYKFKTIDYIKIVYSCAPKITIIEWICTIVFSFLPALQTIAIKRFIDSAIEIYNDEIDMVKIILPLLFMLFIICFQQINSAIMYSIECKQKKELFKELKTIIMDKRSKLKYCYIEDNNVWDLIDRTCSNAPEEIYNNYSNIVLFIQNILQIISLLIVIFTYVWWASVTLAVVCIPILFISSKAGKEDYKAYEESDKIERKANYLHDVLLNRNCSGERILFNYKNFLQKKWLSYSNDSRKLYIKAVAHNTIKIKLAGLFITSVFLLMISLLTTMLFWGYISASVMIAIIGASNTYVDVFAWKLSENMMRFTRSKEYLKDLTAFFELENINNTIKENSYKPKFETVEFKNVSFKYPGTERYVLDNFSLKLYKGHHYAFVGPNGCGKTTIIKLLTGLYTEYEGDIFLNEKNLKDYTISELSNIFSVVFQDFARYNISFFENIKLSSINTNDEFYNHIKKELALDKLSDAFPNKDNTLLGKSQEKGIDISGGEWQKIAIARSLYRKSSFKILDEPTASLDPSAESEVYTMFQNICKNDTTLVITHRLGAAKTSDEIIVIIDGKISEIGDHNSLMQLKGAYYKMFITQRRCFE